MIYHVKGGIRITEEEWLGATPHSNFDKSQNSITVQFKNGSEITITEDFLNHCLALLEHNRKSAINRKPATKNWPKDVFINLTTPPEIE